MWCLANNLLEKQKFRTLNSNKSRTLYFIFSIAVKKNILKKISFAQSQIVGSGNFMVIGQGKYRFLGDLKITVLSLKTVSGHLK